MDWTKIIWALLLGAMILFLWPRAKHMLKNSPKAEKGDWMSVAMPIAFVIGFVILLIMIV
ncbi:MAG: hypothetical protein ABW092_13655 [Candidatus Thiodiazotropha sp.]